MAGHSKFANIRHRKGAQDAKRAKVFTKLAREIITATKIGGPDASSNPRLRVAISAAKAQNLPKDRIESAIQRGSSTNEGDNYEEMRYEGYAHGGIAIIVEALTDNRNRTAADIRSIFTKNGGTLGETGSVTFMFERLGIIIFDAKDINEEEIFESAVEAGAQDCILEDTQYIINCEPDLLHEVSKLLSEKFGDPDICKLTWQATSPLLITDQEKADKLLKLIDALEDSDDVQMVFGAFELSKEIKL